MLVSHSVLSPYDKCLTFILALVFKLKPVARLSNITLHSMIFLNHQEGVLPAFQEVLMTPSKLFSVATALQGSQNFRCHLKGSCFKTYCNESQSSTYAWNDNKNLISTIWIVKHGRIHSICTNFFFKWEK